MFEHTSFFIIIITSYSKYKFNPTKEDRSQRALAKRKGWRKKRLWLEEWDGHNLNPTRGGHVTTREDPTSELGPI